MSATTTEGTGSGSVDNVKPKIFNGVVKMENSPDLDRINERLRTATVEFHVAKHGSDENPGSLEYPFLTIQSAVNHAESSVPDDLGCVINVHPGFYAETVTLERARTHLRGTHAYNDMTMFCAVSRVVFNCVGDMGGSNNTQYAISGMLVSPGSGNCITVAGDTDCTVIIKDCNLYADDAGQKCLVNTNSGNIKVKCNGVVFNNLLSNSLAIDISSGWLDVQRSFIYSGSSPSVNFSGSALTMDGVLMQGAGADVITISGSGQVNISNSLFETSATNADGISLGGTVTCNIVQNVFRVPNGSGYAVNGVSGVVLIHATNAFLPTYNNKFKSAMTILPASTTPVSSA